MSSELSLLEPLGGSYYIRTSRLNASHYQELVDRGWRRSGTLLYLPDNVRSCCPHHTVRLSPDEFCPSRDQRQAVNRWNRYVLGEEYIKQAAIKHPRTKEENKRRNNHFNLIETIHESEISNLHSDIEPAHRFEVTLEPDTYTSEKYSLFEDYQRNVHKEDSEDISNTGFGRFLCGSPLSQTTSPTGLKLGSYHQCYRLDGRLIAFGVLDLLPHAVSGVYFIYHHDFEQWSFGKLSAMREAALADECGYQYYYMGYYIHTCQKSRYKGTYRPQYVLDLDSLEWDQLDDEMKAYMDKQKYVSMSRERRRGQHKASDDSITAIKIDQSPDMDDEVPVWDEYYFDSPSSAMDSGKSLLQMGMPGVMREAGLMSKIDLDAIHVYLGERRPAIPLKFLTARTEPESGIYDKHSLLGVAAEMAAAVGPIINEETVMLDLSDMVG